MDYPGWLKTNPNPVNVLSSDSTTGWLYVYLGGREGGRERGRGGERGGREGERVGEELE